jgi:putative ABC transport system ATP-binding protein
VLAALETTNREFGTTTVLITHNVSIGGMADRVFRFSDGRIGGIENNPTRLRPDEIHW